MKKQVRLIMLLAIMTTLNGCTSMNNQFDCPMSQGVMCKSLDEVNQMVDNGQLQKINPKKTIATLGHTTYPINPFHMNKPLRQQGTVMRIWIAPYEDKAGNYHQDTTIFKVVKPGTWLDHPANEITHIDA